MGFSLRSAAFRTHGSSAAASEDEFQRQLGNARIVGNVRVLWSRASDLPKGGVLGCVRITEVGVVREVEILRAKLQISPLVKRELARQAGIPVHILRANQPALLEGSEGTGSCRVFEAGRIQIGLAMGPHRAGRASIGRA